MIDLDTIGYYLFMEQQEQKEVNSNDNFSYTDDCGESSYTSLGEISLTQNYNM